jgi:hypothetical protein
MPVIGSDPPLLLALQLCERFGWGNGGLPARRSPRGPILGPILGLLPREHEPQAQLPERGNATQRDALDGAGGANRFDGFDRSHQGRSLSTLMSELGLRRQARPRRLPTIWSVHASVSGENRQHNRRPGLSVCPSSKARRPESASAGIVASCTTCRRLARQYSKTGTALAL